MAHVSHLGSSDHPRWCSGRNLLASEVAMMDDVVDQVGDGEGSASFPSGTERRLAKFGAEGIEAFLNG
jgi:hypothetical protein